MRKFFIKLRPANRGAGQGFTLVELVVVIAILGVLAAVAIPFVASHLGQSKDRAYNVDQERFQQAVDAYFSEPGNIHFLGKPQYPIMGIDKAVSTLMGADHVHVDFDGKITPSNHVYHTSSHGLAGPNSFDHIVISEDAGQVGNPLGGTEGGQPKWIDDGSGIREEEDLLDSDGRSQDQPGWHISPAIRKGTAYFIDSRDYFINFERLVAKGLLDEIPASASPDNRPQDPSIPFPLSSDPDNLNPGGITITPASATVALWVADRGSDRVFQYSLDGQLLDGGFALAPVNSDASGITTDGSRFWVLDAGNPKKVYRYDADGTFRPNESFNLPATFQHLEGITFDGTNLWILDGDDGAFRYSTGGEANGPSFPLTQNNSSPNSNNTHAKGITTGDGTTFWVADSDRRRVYRYSKTGNLLSSFKIDPIGEPRGIATDGSTIWVADKDTGQVYTFGLNGGPPGSSLTGAYSGSYSWYVDSEGKVQSLYFYFPESNSTGFQEAYP